MKYLLSVVLCVSLILLHILPKVHGQDDAEIAAARANCDVTYVCCKLKLGRRFRLWRRISWRRRARCLRWCPQETSCIETPTPFEAFDIEDTEEDPNPTEFLHGDSDDSAQTAQTAEESEVNEEEGEAGEDPEPATADDDVIDIPVEGPLPIGITPASVIKVPCNGNFKPDRYGVCRPVFS